MRKAILVMDMPDKCGECECSYCDYDDPHLNLICAVVGDNVSGSDKPDWCPLRPMPEKKPLKGNVSNIQRMMEEMGAVSWNACIDAIGGGDE